MAYYTVSTLPFALVFFLCRGYFTAGWPEASVLLAFAFSLVLAFLLGFFLDLCIGLVGFWFLEVSSLLFVYMLLNFFLSGHMFPLDLVAATLENDSRLFAVQVLGLLPRRNLPGQGRSRSVCGKRLASKSCGWSG